MDIESIKNTVIHGNNLDVLPTLPDNSVDAIVTDPPYGLSFMGKKRDYDVPSQKLWEECLRVLKPGGYLLAFAGTRTQHRMAVRIEDAGFEIRDMIAWVYGSGFPKSLNIGKAVARLQGEDIPKTKGFNVAGQGIGLNPNKELRSDHPDYVKPTYDNEWEGWGTALKPALEPITVARKPLGEKTVAENVLKWGTGGINIDGSRVGTEKVGRNGLGETPRSTYMEGRKPDGVQREQIGRFPANFIHDGSDEVVGLFPNTKSGSMNGTYKNTMMKGTTGERDKKEIHLQQQASEGSASRFFYCAKASKSERNRGCEELEEKERIDYGGFHSEKGLIENNRNPENRKPQSNNHPTVKPIALMEYLIKLVTKEGAIVLDPFAGSGSTLVACKNISRNYIGMEMTEEYIPIIEARLNAVVEEEPEEDIQPSLF